MKPLNNKPKQHHNELLSASKLILAGLLLLLGLSLPAQHVTSNSCTENCHKRTVKKDILHGPTATDCTICHEPNGKAHPVEDVSAFTFFAEGAELCYSCHTEIAEQFSLKYVHKPAKNGECSECHEVHSSNDPKLVFTQAPDLCFFCHSDFDDNRATATSVHTASYTGEACLQCHSPHASTQRRLLVGNNRELCLSCHNKIIKKEDGALLANIEKHLSESTHEHRALGKTCTGCHSPHISELELLLKEAFTLGNYVEGIEDNFALCFQCHDTDLLNVETTTIGTEFRQGDRNLHYVHVNKVKGRNCTNCHDVHAANNSKLIAETVKFGRWDMPLNYIENDNGGTCATGCHKEQHYARE
ncbi:cytochrome c3 family protein [Aestuariivivens sediminicola]|uniref:cytochrome c3 family protein n=1 Tax=Aestuariivivens sediminicola TaxID=2913560 RepID=UPI001F5734A0|nr:cytochrome c3 family protein [Aestuariivivens sediminicola]